MTKCISLLLSGGTGTRLGADIPKQYIRTSGHMMITRSLYELFKCGQIEAVRIVADASWHDEIKKDWEILCGDFLKTGQNDAKGLSRDVVSAAGICGSDIPRIYETGAHKHPLIPCRECAQCRKQKYEMCSHYDYLGSRRDGGFAEYASVPEWNLIELPDALHRIKHISPLSSHNH